MHANFARTGAKFGCTDIAPGFDCAVAREEALRALAARVAAGESLRLILMCWCWCWLKRCHSMSIAQRVREMAAECPSH